jgi:drug/metabolite transporter (DMT)-like permease
LFLYARNRVSKVSAKMGAHGGMNERIALAQLLGSALMFGITIVYQRHAMMRGLLPFTFNATRFPISTLIFAAFILITKRNGPERRSYNASYRGVFLGIICGVLNCFGATFQQVGLLTVSAGKMSFICGSCVIFVPIVESILSLFAAVPSFRVWIAAIINIGGIYYLSGCADNSDCLSNGNGNSSDGYYGNNGEIMIFLSMLSWTALFIVTDIACKEVDYMQLALVEYLSCSVLCVLIAPSLEPTMWVPPFQAVRSCWVDIIIVSVLECLGVVFTILGQIYISPSVTALVSSSGSVYAAVLAYYFLGENMNFSEILGCVLIGVATVLACYPVRSPRSNSEEATSERYGTFEYSVIELPENSMHIGIQQQQEQHNTTIAQHNIRHTILETHR